MQSITGIDLTPLLSHIPDALEIDLAFPGYQQYLRRALHVFFRCMSRSTRDGNIRPKRLRMLACVQPPPTHFL